ncbi:hypothetical protein GE21DRAFT_1042431, partial [Neurospora crassa]
MAAEHCLQERNSRQGLDAPQWLRMVLGCRSRRPLGIFLLLGFSVPQPKTAGVASTRPKTRGRASIGLPRLAGGSWGCRMWGARDHVSNLQHLVHDWLDCLVLLQLYHRALEAHPACDVSLAVWTR